MVGCWHGYLSGARCRLAYGPADAIDTHCLLLQKKIQIGLTILVPAHLSSPGKRAVEWVCVGREISPPPKKRCLEYEAARLVH